MSYIQASTIGNKVQTLLHDESSIRWIETELLMWINSACKEILIHKPNSLTKVAKHDIIAGSLQKVYDKDATVIQILDVIRLVGGSALTNIDRTVLDTTLPNWHSPTSPTSVPRHYIINPLDPKNFYIYPCASADGGVMDVLVSYEPEDVISLGTKDQVTGKYSGGTTLSYDSIYESPIIDYVLYRAYGKDSEHTANISRSTAYYNAFMTTLKGKFTAETALAASAQFTGNNPKAQ